MDLGAALLEYLDGSLTGKFENLVAFLTKADALEQEAVLLAL